MITLPNIYQWRTCQQITEGPFRYQDSGVLDRNYLRFFSCWCTPELVENCPTFTLLNKWAIRYAIGGLLLDQLPHRAANWLDRQTTERWPNHLGFQTHLLAGAR